MLKVDLICRANNKSFCHMFICSQFYHILYTMKIIVTRVESSNKLKTITLLLILNTENKIRIHVIKVEIQIIH